MSEQHEVTVQQTLPVESGDFERSGDGWEGHVSGLCPVQGEGTCDGKPWYFRARGAKWSIWFAERPEADPVDVGISETGWTTWGRWGTWPEAGYMPLDVAWGFVERAIADFRAGKLERIEARVAAAKEQP